MVALADYVGGSLDGLQTGKVVVGNFTPPTAVASAELLDASGAIVIPASDTGGEQYVFEGREWHSDNCD